MRLALLSNVTLTVLARMLAPAHRVWAPSGEGAWAVTALNPPPDLLAFKPERIVLLLDGHFAPYDAAVVPAALARLRAHFPSVPIVMPNLDALAQEIGPSFHDPRLWQLAMMPWSMTALRAITAFLAPHKILALDLDGTLWQGTVGEDGPAGITPDNALQQRVRALRERGVLLVILSKNNPADVTPVWDRPDMLLGPDDFAACGINWSDKADNLTALAAELNLNVDAVVFMDDNPAERAQMRARLPEVCTVSPTADLADLFPATACTPEDAQRTAFYRDEAARRASSAGLTAAEYLKQLDIRVDLQPLAPADFARVAQLSQRANQFNVCTHRYSVEEVARLASDSAHYFIQTMRVADRFGDLGLVAFVIAHITGTAAEIVDWVMSCRAMNRRVEFTCQAGFERALAARGVRTLTATWCATPKNAPVKNLFETMGFTLTRETPTTRHYARMLTP